MAFRTLPVFGADLRNISEVVRGIMDGKTNNTGTVTLSTGNATTTTIETYRDWETDRKSTRLNSSHSAKSRMPSSA